MEILIKFQNNLIPYFCFLNTKFYRFFITDVSKASSQLTQQKKTDGLDY